MHQALLLLVVVFLASARFVPHKTYGRHAEERPGDISLESAKATSLPNATILENAERGTSGGWQLYKQCDSSWGSQRLGTCSQTICQAGCAMSSVAMILRTKGADVNPGTFNNWLRNNGGYAAGCEIYWGKADAFGKTKYQSMQTASEAAICSGVAAGHGIVANVNGGSHWVLITGCAGNGVFYVNDPGFNRNTYTFHEILREAVYH